MNNNFTIDELANRLAPHYSQFNITDRLLFTGHSHQAWPDVALQGLIDSFEVAASRVDTKWEIAFEKTEILRSYLRFYYDDPNGRYTLGVNTHQLLVSWLSALDLKNNPKIVITDQEFHSMYRQLHRLREEGIEVAEVPVEPVDNFMVKLQDTVDEQTAAIMISRVYFQSGLINPHISEIAALARSNDIPLLIDDYHGTNVVPLSLQDANLEDCYLLIGGYKYLQWGEGNCFLRYPKDCSLRPAITGWFASFSSLDQPRTEAPTTYEDTNQRFASGTYDPASQFRAAKVVAFFNKHNLTPDNLRRQYKQQLALMREKFNQLDIPADLMQLWHTNNLDDNGGFLAFKTSYATKLRSMLLNRNVFTDARGNTLRFGPAPYVTSRQIEEAFDILDGCILDLLE